MIKIKSDNNKTIMLCVVLLAAVLRFAFLPVRSLDMDEANSFYAGKLPWRQFMEFVKADSHPPLNYLIYRYTAFRPNIYAIRWIHVIFGIMTVLLIMKISQKLFDNKTAFYSGMIASTSSIFFLYSINSRMYALFSMAVAGMIYYFFKSMESNKWRDFIIYGLLSLCVLYNHYIGVFFFAAGFISATILYRKISKTFIKRFIVVNILAGILFCLWVPNAFNQMRSRSEVSNKLFISSGLIIPYAFYRFTLGKNFIRFFHKSDILIWKKSLPALSVFLIYGLLALSGIYNTRRKRCELVILITFLAAPVLLAYILSLKIPRVLFETRYLIGAAVPYYIFIGSGIAGIRKRNTRILLLIMFIIINAVSIYKFATASENWKHVANYVENRVEPGDLILFDAGYMKQPFKFYFSGSQELIGLPPRGDKQFILDVLISKKRIWFILSHNYRSRGIYKKTLDEKRILTRQFDFVFAKIYLYE